MLEEKRFLNLRKKEMKEDTITGDFSFSYEKKDAQATHELSVGDGQWHAVSTPIPIKISRFQKFKKLLS